MQSYELKVMKNTLLILVCTFLLIETQAQSLIGAWEALYTSENGEELRNVVVFADGYQVATTYQVATGKFVNTNGGTWKLDGDIMTEKVEFHSENAVKVGEEVSFEVNISDNEMGIVGMDRKWRRIDSGEPGKLKGAWLMSGRIRDGETQLRDTSRPRKTMKLLSGTRFQWIAYNTETKEFIGCGGGTYTTINNTYTENIEFFSKDDSKAGISLKFNYELIDGNWHHSGLSSKGDPIYEIWSVRE